MPTNLALDDELINEAHRLGGHKTKKDAVTAALQQYIQRYRQIQVIDLFGAVPYDADYDHKAERRRERG